MHTILATPSGVLTRFKANAPLKLLGLFLFPRETVLELSCEFSWHSVLFLSHIHYALHQCIVLSQEYL